MRFSELAAVVEGVKRIRQAAMLTSPGDYSSYSVTFTGTELTSLVHLFEELEVAIGAPGLVVPPA